MKKVTDPALLGELGKKVTDPSLLAALDGQAPPNAMTPEMGLPRDAVSVLGPDINIERESTAPPWWTQVDQQSIANRIPVAAAEAQFFNLGGVRSGMEPPESRWAQSADAFGAGIGTGMDFAMMAPVAEFAIPARLTQAANAGLQAVRVPAAVASRVAPAAVRSPLLFGGHAQLSGADPKDVAIATAEGLGFGLLPAAPIVRNIAANPVGGEAVGVASLVALNMAHGMPFDEAFVSAIATAPGLKFGHLAAGPVANFKAETTGPRNAERAARMAESEATAARMAEIERVSGMRAEFEANEARRRAEVMAQQPPVEPQVVPPPTGMNYSTEATPAVRASRGRAADAEITAQRMAQEARDADLAALRDMEGIPGSPAPGWAGETMPSVLPPEARMASEAPRRPGQQLDPELVRRAVQGSDRPAETLLELPPGGATGAPSAGLSESPTILTSGGKRNYVSPLKGADGGPLYTESVPTVPRRASSREPFNRGEPVTGTIEVGADGQAILPQQQLTPRRGRQPLPTRRSDPVVGAFGGASGDVLKFRELRDAIAGAARRLGSSVPNGDLDIAARVAGQYKPGMRDHEFFAAPGVKEELLKSSNLDEVLRIVKESANSTPPEPAPSGGPRARRLLPAPKDKGIAALREEADKPRKSASGRDNPVSGGVTDYLKDRDTTAGMAEKLKASGAVPNSERVKAIKAEIEAEVAAKKAEAEASGEAFKESDLYGRPAAEEAEYRELRERRPEADEYFRQMAALGESGEKTPMDVGPGRSQMHAQDYLLQGMGGGKVGAKNVPDSELLRPTYEARDVTYKFNDTHARSLDDIGKRNGIKMNTPESDAVYQLIEAAKGQPIDQFAATPEARAILDGLKNEAGVVGAAKEATALFDKILVERNALTDGFGETPLPYKPGYAPKYEKRPPWWNLKAKAKKSYAGPERAPTAAPSLDPASKAKKSDPHTKMRTGKDIDRDWDFYRAGHRYIGEEASVVGGTIGLHNAYEVARLAELNGFGPAADIIRNYAQSDFNKRGWGLGAQLDKLVTEGGLGNVAGDVFKWNYDRLADAVFTVNLGWNLVVQPSSSVFVGAAGGMGPSTKGILASRNAEFRRFVDDEMFSRRVKARRGGSVGDVGQDMSAVGSTDTGLTKAKHKAQFVNGVIEKEIDYYAAYVGMEQGKKMGLEGRELIDFASDYIKKTQDVYNRQDRPELVRSKMFNVIAPFAGFSFNAKSNLQQEGAIPFASRRGTYEVRRGGQARAAYAFRLALGAAAANALAKALAGRDELYGPSTLPFYSILTGEGMGNGLVGPASVYQQDTKAFKDALDGKWGEAIARELRQRVPAGRVISNLILADKYLAGEGAFPLKEDEYMQAVVFGVWSTKSGQAYIAELEKRDPGIIDRIKAIGDDKNKQEDIFQGGRQEQQAPVRRESVGRGRAAITNGRNQ